MKLDAITERFVKLERKLACLEEELSIKNKEIEDLNLKLKTMSDVVTSKDAQMYNELKHDIRQLELSMSFSANAHIPGDKKLAGKVDNLEHKILVEIDRLKAKAEEAVNALDVKAFDNFKAAVKIALETQRKDNLKDLSRLNARVDKLKVSFSKLLDDLK